MLLAGAYSDLADSVERAREQAPDGWQLIGTRWSDAGPGRKWVVKTLPTQAEAEAAVQRYQQTYDNTRRVAVGS